MTEQFVTYDIALKLNEKGFDWHCLAVYMNGEFQIPRGFGMAIVTKEHVDVLKGKAVLAPLWQQVIEWLRDVKKLEIIVESGPVDLGYSYHIYYTKDGKSRRMDGFGHDELEEVEYDYPEAREEAIKQALTLI